ncbi:MAG TPA: Crp/Fnr family transcriptional regulator [Ktedonobacterales bacterium]
MTDRVRGAPNTEKQEFLGAIPLFAALDEVDLARLAAAAVTRRFDRGEVIEVEGERVGALRIVRSGVVKLLATAADGREQVLRLVPAGQTFNLVAVIDGQPSAATAVALEQSTIYNLDRSVVLALIERRPEIARAALLALAACTREMVRLAKDLALHHVTERVARLLLEQERAGCERCRRHYLTQQEMATIVGTAREVVGRTLHEFQSAGLITLDHGHVSVVDHERLRAIAHERRTRTRRANRESAASAVAP